MRTKQNVVVSKFAQTFFSLFSKFVYVFCREVPQFSNLINYFISVVLFKSVRFAGRWIGSVEIQPSNEKELIKKVISSYNAARRMQVDVAESYQPGGAWREIYNYRWKHFYESISREDYEAVASFLRNFFRNEGITGLWSSDANPFRVFFNSDALTQLWRANGMVEQYLVWRNNLPSVDLKELDAPRVGNPWGYRFGDYLLYEPVFEYNFHAHYFNKLLNDIQEPVVIEIGGGFGGLAYHLLRCRPSIKYIGFDLPENILVQTYYSLAYSQMQESSPSKKISLL